MIHLPQIILLILFSINVLFAQNDNPCSVPESKQFDFWMGEWNLTWPAEQMGGTKGELGRGTNSILKILDGCIIQEEFRFPAQNFNGYSVSVYSPAKKLWQQTWVDNQGSYLLFTGEFSDGKMSLKTVPYKRGDKEIISRMVFKNINKISFDWDWQRSEDGGQSWIDVWNIHYEKKLD